MAKEEGNADGSTEQANLAHKTRRTMTRWEKAVVQVAAAGSSPLRVRSHFRAIMLATLRRTRMSSEKVVALVVVVVSSPLQARSLFRAIMLATLRKTNSKIVLGCVLPISMWYPRILARLSSLTSIFPEYFRSFRES